MSWQDGPWADLVPSMFIAVCFVVFAAGFLIGSR